MTLDFRSDTEWDLNTENGSVGCILCMFHKKNRAVLKPLAEFYMAYIIRPFVTKAKPLRVKVSNNIANSALLKSKDGREAWRSSTKRPQRFTREGFPNCCVFQRSHEN